MKPAATPEQELAAVIRTGFSEIETHTSELEWLRNLEGIKHSTARIADALEALVEIFRSNKL